MLIVLVLTSSGGCCLCQKKQKKSEEPPQRESASNLIFDRHQIDGGFVVINDRMAWPSTEVAVSDTEYIDYYERIIDRHGWSWWDDGTYYRSFYQNRYGRQRR